MEKFAMEHWIAVFIMFWIVASLLGTVFNRLLRSINIAIRGWPPAHLDADGDWKPEEEM